MENDRSPRPTSGTPSEPGRGADAATSPDGPTPYDPLAALADVDAARSSVAARLITPWWYHPILGAIIAAIVLVGALDLSNLIRLPVALAGAVGIGLLVGIYQRMTGVWVDMRNLGPTSRKLWLAYAAIVAVVVGASLIPTAAGRGLPPWVAVLLAAVALFATVVLGRAVDNALREEIRSGVAALPKPRR